MGSANSTPIPGGGTEGYHVLKVMKSFNCIYLHLLFQKVLCIKMYIHDL